MKIFVTGATGFVGKYILEALDSREHQVLAVTRKKDVVSYKNVKWLFSSQLDNKQWLNETLFGVDVVIHAAAYAHQTRVTTEEDRKKFITVNKDLTESIFEAAKQQKVKQFIFISTIGAIKSLSNKLITEKTPPEPSNDYGFSKYLAEESLKNSSQQCSTKLTIIRPCLMYGSGNPGNMERLSSLIEKGYPLPFKSIKARRSFLYVKNLVSFIEKALLNPASFGEDFILADDEILTLPEIVVFIAAAKGTSVGLVYFPEWGLKFLGKFGDILSKLMDRPFPIDSYSVTRLIGSLPCSNKKAKELLDWQPPFKFKKAIQETFNDV